MTPKERKEKAILRILADLKWPSLVPGRLTIFGGLWLPEGQARAPRTDEFYVGMYSSLADAIRDWQDTPAERPKGPGDEPDPDAPPWCPGDRLGGVCPGLVSGIASDCPKWGGE